MSFAKKCPYCNYFFDGTLPSCPYCGGENNCQSDNTMPPRSPIQSSYTHRPETPPIRSPEVKNIRNPRIAALFSFLFLGWGQWYNGRTNDGIFYFGSYIITSFIGMSLVMSLISTFYFASITIWVAGIIILATIIISLGIYIHSIRDAYRTACKINRGEMEFTRKSRLFWFPALMVLLGIGLGLLLITIAMIFH